MDSRYPRNPIKVLGPASDHVTHTLRNLVESVEKVETIIVADHYWTFMHGQYSHRTPAASRGGPQAQS